jgi:septation ring formation regulator EzrA
VARPVALHPEMFKNHCAKELATLEQELQSAQREFEQTQINLGLALEQRERLSAPNLVAAVGPDLQSSLDNELRDLERAETEARERVETLGTRISDIGASQQEGDAGRPSSEVIGDLVRGGSGTGYPEMRVPVRVV